MLAVARERLAEKTATQESEAHAGEQEPVLV